MSAIPEQHSALNARHEAEASLTAGWRAACRADSEGGGFIAALPREHGDAAVAGKEDQRAALVSFDEASRKELATKGDVQDTRLEIEKVRAEVEKVRAEIEWVRAELKVDIENVRAEIENVRAELKTDIEKVKYDLLRWQIGMGIAGLAILAKGFGWLGF